MLELMRYSIHTIRVNIVMHVYFDQQDISESSESDKQNRSFYSVSLDGRRLEARVEAGKGEVRLRSEASYDDNRNHAVTMIKTGRR